MAEFVYSLAVYALLPWVPIYLLWRARRQPEYLQHWAERCGFFAAVPSAGHLRPDGLPVPPAPILWLHAVSVGETHAAQPLVAALRQRYPQHRILMTHMTPTGRAASTALFGDSIARCYLPYDAPWAMRRFLTHFKPEIGLIMETELWPNLIRACSRRGIPLLLVNARLSERSQRSYARFPTLSRQAVQGLAAIGAQSPADAARLEALGARAVHVTGNMKFDIEPPAAQLALGESFRERFGSRAVFLAASTRDGEEALILDAWLKLGAGGTGRPSGRRCPEEGTALLLIVPRHPQRVDEVARLIAARGLRMQRRSEDGAIDASTQVVLGDSMGEMFAYYAAADIAFIGGSLLDFGSQNLIEACAVGTPVLLGPSTFNFAAAAEEALACGAALPITDAEVLVQQALRLLADSSAREVMGNAGQVFANRHRGATQRTMALIQQHC